MKLNYTHQLLVYVVDINTLGGSTHTVRKNIEALLVSSKVTGLKVNADKIKYKVLSRDQHAGKNHKINTDNKFFKRVEQARYLGTTVTNQNSFHEEINRLKPNDLYMGRTAALTSKRCILYIYSTNIGTEYFKHAIYSPFFSLQNAVCFIMLTCLVPALFTFYIQDVLN